MSKCLLLAQHPPCCCSWYITSSQTLSWGDILLLFVNVKSKFSWALKVYCVWFTCRKHTCGWFGLQNTCSREFYRKKKGRVEDIKTKRSNVSAGKLSSSLTLQLSLSPSFSPGLYFFLFLAFTPSLCLPEQTVTFPLCFSREIRLTCRGLKGICSAHQVCIVLLFLWAAAP